MKKISVNGKAYRRALEFAFRACPTSDNLEKLAQVVFLGSRVICANGRSWFVGMLPEDQPVEIPVVAARASIDELLEHLEYAEKQARRHGGNFYVEQDGTSIAIHYRDRTLKHKLAEVPCGHVPGDWQEPARNDAPELAALPAMSCEGGLNDVIAFWKKHGARVSFRGQGPDHPVRVEVRIEDEIVAVAFMLPDSHAAAELPPDEPLFAGTGGPPRGQSILDLSTAIILPPPTPEVIKIGELEWNITGLGHARELLKAGPCDHRDTHEPCAPCTEIAIASARAEVAKKVVPIKTRRPKKKKADDDDAQPESEA